jgi:hypothetical protein
MIKKRIFAMSMAVIMLMGMACKKEKSETDPAINIVLMFMAMAPPCDNSGPLYHEITLDYTTGSPTRYNMGRSYGLQTVALVPDFERIFDWYIYLASSMVPYQTMIDRALAIKNQLPAEYQQEIDGLASVCTGTENKLLDGKLTADEVYLLQVLPDVWISAQCSSVAVFGATSATGNTIIGRNLEWFGGLPHNYLSRLQAVVTVKNVSGRHVCLIGYLGFLGCITGFNNDGLFGAIQVSSGDTSLYDATDKGSYNMILRYVLETRDTVVNAGNYLTSDTREFAAGHLLVFADPGEAQVFEYDPAGLRGMRAWNTHGLRDTWVDHDYTIGAVNSNLLSTLYNNHTGNNVSRWNSMRTQLQSKLDDTSTPDKVTVDEVKRVITYYQGTRPGAVDGDLYRNYIQQTIIYQPATPNSVEVHFHPLCIQSPGYPYTADGFFTPITADF